MIKREAIIELAKKDPAWTKTRIAPLKIGRLHFCPASSCRECYELFPRTKIPEMPCPCEVYSATYLRRCLSFALRVLEEEKLI